MKNISVLTVYDAPNCGSFLQAYATQCLLKNMNCNVSFVKYRKKVDQLKLLFANEKTNLLHPFYYIKRGILYSKIQKDTFQVISYQEVIMRHHRLVIGSDELWNVRNDKYFKNEMFYGGGIDPCKVLVWAISCNEALQEDFDYSLQCLIKRLPKITYRDNHTGEIVKSFGVTASFCCDPTIIVGKDFFKEIYPHPLPDKYLVIYAYHVSQEQKKCITEYAKKNNLQIVSMCSAFSWANVNLACLPVYFPNIIDRAELVITGTFHGSVFSLLYNKKFICIKSTPKIIDLLKRYKKEELINIEITPGYLDEIMTAHTDWSLTNMLLSSDQIAGKTMLKEFIENE